MRVIHSSKLSILLIPLLLLSCKKKDDTERPQIEITTPSTLTNYNYLDVLNVSATVTDNNTITAITIDVVDASLVSVMPSRTETPNSASYTMTEAILLDNVHIETGTHYVKVTATDGYNDVIEYQEIFITGAPLIREGILMIGTGGGVVDINLVDDMYNVTSYYSEARDFSDASISSYYQYFTLAGSFNNSFKAMGLQFQDVIYEKPSESSWPEPYFYEVYYSEDSRLTYVSTSDETESINGYNKYGTIQSNLDPYPGHRPHRVLEHDDYALVEQHAVVGTDIDLAVYFKSTGFLMQSQQMDMDLVGLFGYDPDNAIVFGNDLGQGYVAVYVINEIPSGNYFWYPATASPGVFHDAVQVDSDTYVLSHDDGIMVYSQASMSFTTIVPGVVANELAYDKLNNLILAADGSTMNVYSMSGSLITTVANGQPIDKILVWYNK